MGIAPHTPHRSVRAAFPHMAPYNRQGSNNIIFTSNKNPSQWKYNFSDDDDLLCALDRIFDDATVFNIRGDSYRGKSLENITLKTSRVSATAPMEDTTNI